MDRGYLDIFGPQCIFLGFRRQTESVQVPEKRMVLRMSHGTRRRSEQGQGLGRGTCLPSPGLRLLESSRVLHKCSSWLLKLLFDRTPPHSTVSSHRWCLHMSRAGLEEKEFCVHKGRCYGQHPWATGRLPGRGRNPRQQRSEFWDRTSTGPTY